MRSEYFIYTALVSFFIGQYYRQPFDSFMNTWGEFLAAFGILFFGLFVLVIISMILLGCYLIVKNYSYGDITNNQRT